MFLTSLFVFGYLFGFNGLNAEASVVSDKVIKKDEAYTQSAVRAGITPSNLNGVAYKTYTITTSSLNHTGTHYHKINFGDGDRREGYGTGRRNWGKAWSTNSLRTYTMSAQVTHPDYGPSPWFYGKATIVYR